MNAVPLGSATRKKCPLSPRLLSTALDGLGTASERQTLEGKEVNLLFTDDMIIYVENTKEFTKSYQMTSKLV